MGVPSKADLRKQIDELERQLRSREGSDAIERLNAGGETNLRSNPSYVHVVPAVHDESTSYGTLVIAPSGRGKYLGPSAASEWLKDVCETCKAVASC